MSSSASSLLARLPAELRTGRLAGQVTLARESPEQERKRPVEADPVLPLGVGTVDALLPGGGLPQGAVVEFRVPEFSSLATTLALRACQSAQERNGGQAWCGFVDPSGTLHASGVLSRGVSLDRMIVVRPPLETLGQVALRMAEAQVFSLLVVDTVGTIAQPLDVPWGPWVRVVRRLSLALRGTEGIVLLLTDQKASRSLALPVAQRLELRRKSQREFSLAITKDLRGRLAPARVLGVGDLLGSVRTRPGLRSLKPRSMAGAA